MQFFFVVFFSSNTTRPVYVIYRSTEQIFSNPLYTYFVGENPLAKEQTDESEAQTPSTSIKQTKHGAQVEGST